MGTPTNTALEPLTVSVKQAAELTGFSQWTIRDLCWKGIVNSRRHGRRVLVEYDSLVAYIHELEPVA